MDPIIQSAIEVLTKRIATLQDAIKALQALETYADAKAPPIKMARLKFRKAKRPAQSDSSPPVKADTSTKVLHGYTGAFQDKPKTVGGAMKYLFHNFSSLTRAELKAELLADSDWAKAMNAGPKVFGVNLCGWTSSAKLKKIDGANVNDDRFEVLQKDFFDPSPSL
jgi:hypothetical protein